MFDKFINSTKFDLTAAFFSFSQTFEYYSKMVKFYILSVGITECENSVPNVKKRLLYQFISVAKK